MKLTRLMILGILFRCSIYSATASVTTEVMPINELSISGTETIQVASAGAGVDPTATTSTSTYSITTNDTDGKTKKISCRIDSAWSVTSGSADILTLEMEAPSSGTASIATPIPAAPTSAFDFISNISAPVANSALSLTFVLTTTNLPSGNQQRTATYTLLDT